MSPRRIAQRALAALALAAVLAPVDVSANPAPPNVDRPLYTHDDVGLDHFVQDDLPVLVAGQKWEWGGHAYEVVRLARVMTTEVVRPRKASRNREAATRGWVVASVHVRVDGKLRRGRIEATAGYAWEPGGWIWEQALLYLGGNDSYDFVAKKVL